MFSAWGGGGAIATTAKKLAFFLLILIPLHALPNTLSIYLCRFVGGSDLWVHSTLHTEESRPASYSQPAGLFPFAKADC